MRFIKTILTVLPLLLLPLLSLGFQLQKDATLRKPYHQKKAQTSMHKYRRPYQFADVTSTENRKMIEERTKFLKSWRFLIGAQVVLSGTLGTIAPSVLLRLAHVQLEPDGAMMLFSCLWATTICFGHCIMNSEENLATIAGALYFSGWSGILLAAFNQQVVSGWFVGTVGIWQMAMAGAFFARTVINRKAFRHSIPESEESHQQLFRGREMFIKNILCLQLFIFGITGLLFPTFFFQQVFFMLNEPTSPPMMLFARCLALTSALLGGLLLQIKRKTYITRVAAGYFGSMSLISFFTCGNPLSPLFAPIDSILALLSLKLLASC